MIRFTLEKIQTLIWFMFKSKSKHWSGLCLSQEVDMGTIMLVTKGKLWPGLCFNEKEKHGSSLFLNLNGNNQPSLCLCHKINIGPVNVSVFKHVPVWWYLLKWSYSSTEKKCRHFFKKIEIIIVKFRLWYFL